MVLYYQVRISCTTLEKKKVVEQVMESMRCSLKLAVITVNERTDSKEGK